MIKKAIYSTDVYHYYNDKGDKTIFKDIIDRTMMSNIQSETKKRIYDLPLDKRRMAILSFIGEDRMAFLKLKELIDKEILDDIEHMTIIIKMIREYVKISQIEIRNYCDVLTPTNLITSMLDKLPKHVWSDPNLKWLDASNGVGSFLCFVIQKLMNGLKSWENDVEKRYNHIVTNMIYCSDIQPINVFSYLCTVDPKNKYDMNIYCGDSLSKEFDNHKKNVWEVDKFDVILGSPPFVLPQVAKGKRGGGTTLWDKFVINYINNLVDNGYLCLVHPTLWRKPSSEKSSSRFVNNILMKKQFHYIEMHNKIDGQKTFNGDTRYDFYVMENCPIYKKTIINGEDRRDVEIDLKGYEFIPNYNIKLFNKLIAKYDEERCPIIFNRTNYGSDQKWVSDKYDDINKYKLVHSTTKNGIRWMYSSRNDNGHFGISKIIFGESGLFDVVIDMEGEYGMTQCAMAIKVDSLEEAENIKSVLLSEDFSEFLKTVIWSNFRIDWRLFEYLKKDFWKEFNKIP
jgi:hypothetical protein